MFKCKECGNEISENEKFCPNCGTYINQNTIYEEVENQNNLNQNNLNQNNLNQNNLNQNEKFCQNCGQKIDINAEICPKCGVRLIKPTEEKNPFLALLLSAIYPGLGQFYNNQSKKGVILVIAAIISGLLILFLIGFILYPLVWIYGIYDAHKTANDINNGINVVDEISFKF